MLCYGWGRRLQTKTRCNGWAGVRILQRFADGEISFPKEESLSVYDPVTDRALLGLAPDYEDYVVRNLPIPHRLSSLVTRGTPENFKGSSDEVDVITQECNHPSSE